MNITDEMVDAALAVLHEDRRAGLDALKAADAALLAAARSHVREALTAALSALPEHSCSRTCQHPSHETP